MADLTLYRLTTEARERFESSGLSAREVARWLGTSPTQLYRLLDPTNYAKSLKQLLALLYLLGAEVEVEVRDRECRRARIEKQHAASLDGRIELRTATSSRALNQPWSPGLYEVLVTTRIQQLIGELSGLDLAVEVSDLANAESADRVSRHIAQLVARAIEALPESQRAEGATRIAAELLGELERHVDPRLGLVSERPLEPGQVLQSILQRRPDGSPELRERPLTPLLDTTVLTNAPGEPAVAHEIRAEIPSADAIDVLMAFIRWSGIRAWWRSFDVIAKPESRCGY